MRCSDCSNKIKPVVALDIDGTLGDYYTHFQDFARDYHNLPRIKQAWNGVDEWENYMGLTKAEYREAKLAYRQGGGKRLMPPFHGAMMISHNVRQVGAELWLTTTRPWMRHDSTDPDTQHWLKKNQIEFDRLVYDDRKYEKLYNLVDAERVVFVLDDLPEMYDDATTFFKSRAWLMARPHNRNVHSVRLQEVHNLVQAWGIAHQAILEWIKEHE